MFLQSGSSKNEDQNTSFNSPYKNIIKNTNFNWDINSSYNEENDFKKHVRNKVKTLSKLSGKSKTVSKRKRRIQKTNLVKNYGVSIKRCDDFDSEHTDLALTLSKSLQTSGDEDEILSINCTQSEENVLALRTNLKKFGFETSYLRSSNVKSDVSLQQEHKKHGKFKFITPTLFLRTEEDRNRIIASKIDTILTEQNRNINGNKQFKTGNLYSKMLSQFYCKENKLFNHVELTNFCVEKIGILPKKEKVDRYLRDWRTIPGRDRSPTPEKIIFDGKVIPPMEDNEVIKAANVFSKDKTTFIDNFDSKTKVKRENVDVQDTRCTSPDLFESDEESLSLPNRIENNCHESNTSSENSSRIDFIHRNENEEQAYSICPSDSQLEKSFNVTEYVMKILNHDSTICLNNYLNSTQIVTEEAMYEPSKDVTNLDSLGSVNAEQLTSKQNSKTTDKRNSYNKLTKNQEDGLNFRCNTDYVKDEGPCNIVFDIEEDNVDVTEGIAFKTNSECSVYSNVEKDFDYYPPIEINCGNSNSQKKVEISSEDEDHLPIISVKKNGKAKSANSFLTSNYESLEITTKNENNISEHLKLLQCGDNLVQIIHGKNTLMEKTGKQIENIISSNEVKPTYSSNFNNDILQDNFQVGKRNEENCSISFRTPKQQVAIKVDNVTPMIDYEDLDSPEIHKELDKFGLKPLKRKRGIEFLKYIYESTHPVLHINDEFSGYAAENEEGIIKKVKENNSSSTCKAKSIEIVGDLISEKEDTIIIERKRSSSKLATCAVPLHIAWFNFISCNPQIKESILLYEPLQLESLCTSLQEQGYKYNIEDMVHFLDKKCINIRRNNNHSKRNRW
ncbi:structure-specific endonuclease subunit SLX4 isoform X2 [Agrilus planipennis]|uniref:Structure-specific endonuclease subunit SLX4 n=1 Tax=Agrilus planipennis TaxID=224129 RepID=A0A1W4WNB9_AGRPL|nr:structure-specific endonuclease subunit SLX4 isoform X2 [Agrilus planipennis]